MADKKTGRFIGQDAAFLKTPIPENVIGVANPKTPATPAEQGKKKD